MSKTIKQILLKVDLFTPHFEYEIENQQTRFATKSGGVFTLMICCIAVAFTSVRINDWLKGQLETSSYNYYFLPKDNFTTNLNQIKLSLKPIFHESQDPFLWNTSKKAFTAHIENQSTHKKHNLTNKCGFIKQDQTEHTYCLDEDQKIKLEADSIAQVEHKYVNFYIEYCDNSQDYCSSKEDTERFFKNLKGIEINFTIQQYSISEQKLIEEDIVFDLYYDDQQLSESILQLQQTSASIDAGLPFSLRKSDYSFISNYQLYYLNPKGREKEELLKSHIFAEVKIYLSKFQLKQVVKAPSFIDEITLAFSFYKLLYTIGIHTVKKRASNLLNKKIKTKFRSYSSAKHDENSNSNQQNRPRQKKSFKAFKVLSSFLEKKMYHKYNDFGDLKHQLFVNIFNVTEIMLKVTEEIDKMKQEFHEFQNKIDNQDNHDQDIHGQQVVQQLIKYEEEQKGDQFEYDQIAEINYYDIGSL